ncbi:asparagine synthase-related protein [Sphingopyxis jiangsuensis]|uniref:asparagine synthase-related protein n=1 Tax=Sphingopyxis jiangsuensis TaxID=2871171 RepID=UPI001F453B00|nr:asparagine synthase C-terminal domain-containing protein [Sphingopyxis lutea]
MADGSVLLGEVFSLSGASCHAPSDGWGNYLAFARREGRWLIDRAPLTGAPLYWTRWRGGILCASHLELIADLLESPTVDWEFIAQALIYSNLRTERTGLTGLSELLPGMRLAIDDASAKTIPLWSPWEHVGKAINAGIAELAPELERRLVASVRAWSGTRKEIMLELSGGLDSSIVAAALSAAGSDFTAINFVTRGADGDERHYARAVASRCGIELIESEIDPADVDLVARPSVIGARPGAYAVLRGIDRAFERGVGGREVSLFGGIGGDNIFCFDGSVSPFLDAAATFGMGRRAFRTLRDVARGGGATLWGAALLAWKAWRRGPRDHWRSEPEFLSPDAIPAAPFAHPWDEGARGQSQAKRNHVEAVRRILDFVDRPPRWAARDVVAPLLSQPVVEYCLSIPSWTWIEGGRDRAVARAAFAHRLPPEVVWRRGKGRLESVATAAYLRQRAELAELLLGGRLAEHGLLDLDAIRAYLVRDLADGDFLYYRLLEIADVELWVRSVEELFASRPSFDQRSYCGDLAGSGSTSSLSQ